MVSAMEKEKLNAYAARVSQANRSELVVIMYEAFLDSVKEGDAQMKFPFISVGCTSIRITNCVREWHYATANDLRMPRM